ncbi:hypothetical protein YTPLAS18_37140 [Nitrospira sp.]|nr:hypothetical protein YTPLAS18_37140 [Nitrospira sp.]
MKGESHQAETEMAERSSHSDGQDPDGLDAFWSVPEQRVLGILRTRATGLSQAEALERRPVSEAGILRSTRRVSDLGLLASQFTSPIILILLGAASVAFFLHQRTDAIIILSIVSISGLLGFWQERGATRAVERLLAMVQIKSDVLRDGIVTQVAVESVLPGDVILLRAGDTVPGDGLLLESRELFVDEATLTGETYPVEKLPGVLSSRTPLARRSNSLFLGTHVVSGTGTAVVVAVGRATEFGRISQRLRLRPPETEFERGVRRLGFLLMEVTMGLVGAIFVINVFFKRPVLDSFLFSMALAVGLTPQLLPAIISINLAHGAKRMAQRKVIVKRLAAIENFGSMTVFCSDKTGTLTEGRVHLKAALDVDGCESEGALLYAAVNATLQSGFMNPIDEAIRANGRVDLSAFLKLDEQPYDFVRKRLSILVAGPGGHLMVTKGALRQILQVCTSAETEGGVLTDMGVVRESILRRMHDLSEQGLRVLGVAYRRLGAQAKLGPDDEADMIFAGMLVFTDLPKPDVAQTVSRLREMGVALKMLTGDGAPVAACVAKQVGLAQARILTGDELRHMSDDALVSRVNDIEVFAEVEPNQKERIILALKKAGHVVGYGGDGINDASAIHAADVGISVDSAVDVAKEAADIVLLEKDLGILIDGVREGRVTFANTLKYVFMATSANFGNMFSMAAASLFLPFLPLLPKQILLTNLLTDIPEMAIATDRVDDELIERPRRWNIRFIRQFMLTFGLVSSLFDVITFGFLLWLLQADVTHFRTGWFVESVVSAAMIVLVIRSRRSIRNSRPSRALLMATLVVVAFTVSIPYLPLREALGFAALPVSVLAALAGIVVAYAAAAEWTKIVFYRRITL